MAPQLQRLLPGGGYSHWESAAFSRRTLGADVGSIGINSSETDSRAIGGERTRATAIEDSEELPD